MAHPLNRRRLAQSLAVAGLIVWSGSKSIIAQPLADPSLGRHLPDGLIRLVVALFLGLGAMWGVTSFGQWLGARLHRYPSFAKPSAVFGVIAGIAVFVLVLSKC